MRISRVEFSVAIVGAGPAGSSAALRFKQLGADVVLIDRFVFPREKVCGDGIPEKALRLAYDLGFGTEDFSDAGNPVKKMHIYGPGGQSVVFGEDRADAAAKSFCISRKIFDNILFQKAASLVDRVLIPFNLVNLKRVGDKWNLELKETDGDRTLDVKAHLLIGADGANSVVARKTGLFKERKEPRFLGLRCYFIGGPFEQAVYIFYDRAALPGYCWIFPVSENLANVGIMIFPKDRKGNPQNVRSIFEKIVQQNKEIRRLLKGAKPKGECGIALLPLGASSEKRTDDGLILIGDAAGFVNPMTGGGIYNAMLSGITAAQIGAKALVEKDCSRKRLREYETWWRKNLLPGFRFAQAFQKFLNSNFRSNWLFNRIRRNGILAAFFIAVYGQPLSKFVLLQPHFWIKIITAGLKNSKRK
ncbi:MAG: NAD(P)/FAD-dependent oxidoreductase [Calditrichaeota bacterium]|nr:NAD(P)/FAD-dependent oxidoreductase [Calditrichota bacterium]